MKTECCGEVRTSAFCPDCGRALQPTGTLHSLLKHCRTRCSAIRKEREYFIREQQRAGIEKRMFEWMGVCRTSKWLGVRHERREKAAAKWQGWVETLEAVIEKSA